MIGAAHEVPAVEAVKVTCSLLSGPTLGATWRCLRRLVPAVRRERPEAVSFSVGSAPSRSPLDLRRLVLRGIYAVPLPRGPLPGQLGSISSPERTSGIGTFPARCCSECSEGSASGASSRSCLSRDVGVLVPFPLHLVGHLRRLKFKKYVYFE